MKIGNIEVYGIIYVIKNKINNKAYVGQTVHTFNERYCFKGIGVERVYNYHKYHFEKEINENIKTSCNKHLFNAIKKYSFENFEVNEILDVAFSREELNIKEKLWIQYYDSFYNGYNKTLGGEGCSGRKGKLSGRFGIKHSKESIQKMRISSTGKYHTEDTRKKMSLQRAGAKAINATKVICLNTNEVFDYINQAQDKYNINRTGISACCRGIYLSSGELNNEKLVWMYYKDYLNVPKKELEKYVKKRIEDANYKGFREGSEVFRKVICLNTKEVFNTIVSAADKYNILDSTICGCCSGAKKSAGKLNGEKLVWMYYEDYINLSNKDNTQKINQIMHKANTHKRNKVICLNTNEIFEDRFEASKKYGCSEKNIAQACRLDKKSSGRHPETKEKLVWMYLKDYENCDKEEINQRLKDGRGVKVVNLNDGKSYVNLTEASKKYGIGSGNITTCCKKKSRVAGRMENGEKIVWMYYEEYIELSKEEIKNIILKANTKR